MSVRPICVRRLCAADAESFRAIRLEALQRCPEAFGASWEDERRKPASWFVERLQKGAVFGGFLDEELTGIVGFHVPESEKQRHKGLLWGMYVREAAWGGGLGKALATCVIEYARERVEQIQLTVVTTNERACRLYTRLGFETYGVERRALRVGPRYFDEQLMVRNFG